MGVVFWGEYYEHKLNAELQAEHRKWEHHEKVKALLKKRDQLIEKTQQQIKQEINQAERVLAEELSKASTKREQEKEKYPQWYEAADELDKILSSGSTSTSQ